MPEFAQCFRFDLTDALSGYFEILSHFFQRVVCGFSDTETLAQNLFFARGQRFQCAVDLSLQIVTDGCFERRNSLLVLDEVAQMAVFLLTDGCFQRDRFAGDFENLPDFVEREIHPLGDFLWGRFPPQFLYEMTGGPDQFINGFNHMNRDPDCASLVSDRPCDSLTDPPCRV